MAFITSPPTPVSQRMGIRPASTTHTVINFGLRRWIAPSITAASMSFVAHGNAGFEPVVQSFVEIDNHDNSGFNGNAEERDVADPHRYAKVVAEQLLQNPVNA